MLFHPDDRIAIIRKTSTDAGEVIQTISTLMELPEVQALFTYAHGIAPKKTVDRNNKLVFNFKRTVTPEGSIDGYGIDTGITGKHYDKILLDDIITIKDRISKAERELVKHMLRELVTNIIDPGKQVGHVGTPWHSDDAWTLTDSIPEPVRHDVYSTEILTAEEIERKRKSTTAVQFAANYELKHIVDAESIFKDPHFAPWDYKVGNVKGHIDAKYDGLIDTNGLTFMARKPDRRIQAVGFTFPENVKEKYEFIRSMYERYNCKKMHCEKNADKGFLADKLKDTGLSVDTPYHESMNKHVKITTHLLSVWENIDWSPDTDDEYLNQIISYREGESPDDCPDSAASLIRIINNSNNNLGVW